ncbi:MAG TPA: sigma-70 family RNA polymerase sigma factor [Polyangiaceae bacterium]|nr:sigma-70 family RNA polymerase sigma factor [Polyangiaceae bacterium]
MSFLALTLPVADDCRDEELVARMARSDRAALSLLYARHAPRLLARVRQVLGDPSEAEDVLHDTFLEAWRRAADYCPERGSVAAWLAVRARSRALDRRRRPSRRDLSLAPEVFEETVTRRVTRDEPRHAEDRGRLAAALAAVSAEEREVLVLGYFAGLSSSEIAHELTIPIGTVKSRVRSALAKLRGWFAGPLDAT